MTSALWTAEQDAILRSLYDTSWSWDRIGTHIGTSGRAAKSRAYRIGLKKGRRRLQYLSVELVASGHAVVTVPHHGGVKSFLLDAEDVPTLLRMDLSFNIHAEGANRNSFYVYTSDRQKLHRILLDAPPNVFVDHKNGDGLDNRRFNLRLATCQQNSRNSKRRGVSPGFKGVWLHRFSGLWTGTILHSNGWRQSIGYHHTPEAAAKVRDRLAQEIHGEFARLNFPVEANPEQAA